MSETAPQDADTMLDEIRREFGDIVPVGTGPVFQGQLFIEMTVGCEFERYSHESWDLVHCVRFPMIRAMWKSTTGWRFCAEGVGCAHFEGCSLSAALAKGLAFLQEAAPVIREAKESEMG